MSLSICLLYSGDFQKNMWSSALERVSPLSEEVRLEDRFPKIRMSDSEGVKLEVAPQFGVSSSIPVYSLCVLPETSAYLPLAESIDLFKYLIFFGQY